MSKFWKHSIVAFILLFVLTYLWHNLIFASQYGVHLAGIVRMVNGAPAPRFAWFILAHVIVALAFAMLLPMISKHKGEFLKNGATLGLLTFGFFAILSHGLFGNWTTWLMGMDVAFGIIAGGITGWVLGKMS